MAIINDKDKSIIFSIENKKSEFLKLTLLMLYYLINIAAAFEIPDKT